MAEIPDEGQSMKWSSAGVIDAPDQRHNFCTQTGRSCQHAAKASVGLGPAEDLHQGSSRRLGELDGAVQHGSGPVVGLLLRLRFLDFRARLGAGLLDDVVHVLGFLDRIALRLQRVRRRLGPAAARECDRKHGQQQAPE